MISNEILREVMLENRAEVMMHPGVCHAPGQERLSDESISKDIFG